MEVSLRVDSFSDQGRHCIALSGGAEVDSVSLTGVPPTGGFDDNITRQ